MSQIIDICLAELRERRGMYVTVIDEDTLEVALPNGESIDLFLDYDVDVEDDEVGIVNNVSRKVAEIEDGSDVLYACLNTICDKLGSQITDITTDGSTDDCEAIFCWDGDYVALKVR